MSRRRLLASAAGLLAAGCVPGSGSNRDPLEPPFERPDVFPARRNPDVRLPSGLDPALTLQRAAAVHNNFYEFLPGRAGPVFKHTADFTVDPWRLEVVGECQRPFELDLDDLFAFPHEERLYHFRCVERWAMNVPWSGFPLRLLLERAEPLATARYVSLVSAGRPPQMPGLARTPHYPWPYHEGLRLDEAMHDLTLLATGIYGQPLLKQHGAPVRLVVPWKYGYKSAKSLVRIELTRDRPPTFWSRVAPHEYGFLSNVNPNVPHPRWKQELSFWLVEGLSWPNIDVSFPTPLLNGYAREVGHLYPDEPMAPQRPLQVGQVAR